MALTPLPETIFKYDSRAKKYVPANHLFQDYALREIDDEINLLGPRQDQGYYLSDRLEILLRYIYAGKEEAGWTFFEREYDVADRDEVKSRVEKILKNHPFYKFVYAKAAI